MSATVVSALVIADKCNAPALKKACFSTLFFYGKQLLTDSKVPLDEMPPSLLAEMLRDHAARRVEHMPGFEESLDDIEPFAIISSAETDGGGQGGSAASGRKRRKTNP